MIAVQSPMEVTVASITIRRVDDETKNWLRRRAAATGRSVEGEVRHMLTRERERDDPGRYPPGMAPYPGEGLGSYLVRISRPGYDLELPDREADELRPVDFG